MTIKKKAEAKLHTHWGDFSVIAYEDEAKDEEHLLLYMGDLENDSLLRIHSQCLTGDTLYSLKCDCGSQLAMALEKIASEGKGMIIYMAQEGRGIGLVNKIRAYELQDQGMDTVEANEDLGLNDDERLYYPAKEILDQLKIKNVKLITNNPKKVEHLKNLGINVTKRIAIKINPNKYNKKYLETKSKKSGHIL